MLFFCYKPCANIIISLGEEFASKPVYTKANEIVMSEFSIIDKLKKAKGEILILASQIDVLPQLFNNGPGSWFVYYWSRLPEVEEVVLEAVDFLSKFWGGEDAFNIYQESLIYSGYQTFEAVAGIASLRATSIPHNRLQNILGLLFNAANACECLKVAIEETIEETPRASANEETKESGSDSASEHSLDLNSGDDNA